jgi:hypothetical protein
MWAANLNFSDPTGALFDHNGEFVSLGDLAIGTGNAHPSQQIKIGHITGSGGVVISYPAGNINIDGSGAGAGIVWEVIGANQTLAVQHGYFCTAGGVLALLLPPVSVLGDTIEISIEGSAGFQVTQGAGQSIKYGNQISTVGAGGSISSLSQGDSIRMVCRVANLSWVILSSMGNLTFV